jgi:hypothetical protein
MSQLVKTKRQVNFKDFQRFGAFKRLVEQKTLYSTRSLGVFGARFTHAKKAQFKCALHLFFFCDFAHDFIIQNSYDTTISVILASLSLHYVTCFLAFSVTEYE